MSVPMEKPAFGVLDGVKVVYAAVEAAVPRACDLMADWGAEVVWLENTHNGDSIRVTDWIKEVERRNQRSVSLNYFNETGKEILKNILADADIFIEGSKGGTWTRHGITDDFLWEANPQLVIVHLSGYGLFGKPDIVSRAGYDMSALAYSGYLSQIGLPDEPMIPACYTADYMNSLMAVGSSLAALLKAKRTGTGESIDLAMYETPLTMGQYYMADYLNAGISYPRPGSKSPNLCATGVYRCADGDIGLCVYGVPQNKYCVEAIGKGHLWGTDIMPDDTIALLLEAPYAQEIESALEEYCSTRSRFDIEKDFCSHGIVAQAVFEYADFENDEHMRLREDFVEWKREDGGVVKGVNIIPKFSQTPGKIWRPMPSLGADTRLVLEKAGYSPEQIDAFAADGIVRTLD